MGTGFLNDLLTVAVERGADATLLTVRGELDHWSAAQLRDELEGCLWSGARHFVVDVVDVSFVDSGGIRPLLEATAAARHRGGDVSVVGAGSGFRSVVDALHLGSRLSLDG
jgi:anti-anti-sigma factor